VLIMTEPLWKSNLNRVKDVPMIYVNFIIRVIIVPEKKIGITNNFVLPLVFTKILYVFKKAQKFKRSAVQNYCLMFSTVLV
jgi:hypothetical protein